MFHSLGGSVSSSPWRSLNWFVFLMILGGRNLVPQMMQASAVCPIPPQNSQIILCIMQRDAITGCRYSVSFWGEDEGPKLWELWPEGFNSDMKILQAVLRYLIPGCARSDWTSPFIPPRLGVQEWIGLDRIFYPYISWEWVFTTL